MRHLRNPISYELSEKTSPKTKSQVKERLKKDLRIAIKTIIQSDIINKNDVPNEKPIRSTFNPGTFLERDESLGAIGHHRGQPVKLIVPQRQFLFLRLIPELSPRKIKSPKTALELIQNGRLLNLERNAFGSRTGRNKHGAFVCDSEGEDQVLSLTQLFLNKELWGINTHALDSDYQKKQTHGDFGYFPFGYIESILCQSMENYLGFAKNILGLPTPLKFIAGATDVEGYRITAPNGTQFTSGSPFGGHAINNYLIYVGRVDNYEISSEIIMDPFFDHLWEECGVDRPHK